MDVLTDILSSLRLSGGVVVDGEFSGDFCLLAHFTPNHFAPFFPEPEKLISYHYVRSGHLILELEGSAPVTLDAGSIAILPRNDPHTLASKSGLRPADGSDVTWVTDEGVHHVSTGTAGPKAEVWCGFLGTAKISEHPLLQALPPLLTLDVQGGAAEWLDSSMRFLAEQNPSPDTVARLAELFLAQAVREYVERLSPDAKGWLRGLADPAVSRALSGRDRTRELVLLAHQPRSLLMAEPFGVGLQLSGHTHGGQIWPFKYLVRLQQPFVEGLHRRGGAQIYVSRGTGYWGPPMRLGAPAEITHITLESAAAG